MIKETHVASAVTRIWMEASRARRHLERPLREVGLTFPLWWVLSTTERLVLEKDDAISQREVSVATELDKNTVSYLMRELSSRGLVDIGPAFGYQEYRVILTRGGEALLQAAQRAIELALPGPPRFPPIPPKR